ncbi:nocturnin isoform X2 [Macrosteles quadrilineatus]|uniref:nocturnin isoform X2 n=1 Tax=Macrosteles quadrilineatus TaxID=74068 RepID=UPI0023E2A63B|nr:nocturnin isoform X2 [Macrosteles quadrilineatus]
MCWKIICDGIRMGSFNSAPKILNEDTQDDDVELPPRMTPEQILSHCRAQVPPPPLIARRFRHLQPETDSKSPSKTIRLLQWNLLSQALGQNNDNFVCCPDTALEWERRRHLLAEEIIRYNPDIICLQEVDHFKFLQKVLGTQGFSGTFFPKPDSPCMYIKGNNGPDGCAIFYNTERYELVKLETRILEVWRVQSNQVAILVILRDKQTEDEICVATTHLKARNGALLSALRNEQGKDLLEFVAQHAGNRPVILSGDFNAEPTEPIYSTVLSHDLLRLSSAYYQENEPPYTTWKIREEGEVCHTIDYVFCSKDRLKPVTLLEFPTGEEIGKDRIPSMSYPSDHFSLVCDLLLKDAS